AAERFAVLQTAARILADNALFGVGFGAYARANHDYNPAVGKRDTHNTYVNIAAETGLPGLALFLAMIVSVLLAVNRARRVANRGSTLAETLRWLHMGWIGFMLAALFGS